MWGGDRGKDKILLRIKFVKTAYTVLETINGKGMLYSLIIRNANVAICQRPYRMFFMQFKIPRYVNIVLKKRIVCELRTVSVHM